MKYCALLLAGLGFLAIADAGQDFNCMQDCYRQGYDRNYCISMCNTDRSPQGGMLDQPGLPRNPAFDQLQQNSKPVPLPRVADPQCMKNCQKHGYGYRLCQQRCSY